MKLHVIIIIIIIIISRILSRIPNLWLEMLYLNKWNEIVNTSVSTREIIIYTNAH